jgi:hypothetical protein
MHYDLDMLQDDIHNLSEITNGWRNLVARAPGDDLDGLDPNSPEAAAQDYFLDKYGPAAGPDAATRFFAIHGFVMRNLHKLERRGLLKPVRRGPPMAEDLLRFLLTCFESPTPPASIPSSIYDPQGGLALPFTEVMADFARLRALRERVGSRQ